LPDLLVLEDGAIGDVDPVRNRASHHARAEISWCVVRAAKEQDGLREWRVTKASALPPRRAGETAGREIAKNFFWLLD
jgi:hypothetical protein